jgi:hypothetical protein
MTRNAVPSGLADVGERADVRVGQLRDGASFAIETLARITLRSRGFDRRIRDQEGAKKKKKKKKKDLP